MGEDCKRAHRMFGGCRFEPRYDERMGAIPGNITRISERSLEQFRVREYVCDVCVRCGHVVQRKEPTP